MYLVKKLTYFNKLDAYAEARGLDIKQIIDSVRLGTKIGNHYNNHYFRYSRYCLLKDTK